MKKQTARCFTAVVFLCFLGCMAILTLLLPKQDFSETEKRYLSEFPELRWETVSSGQWGEDLEQWLADHVPGRNFFVGLDAYKELLLGQQAARDIRLYQGRLVEAPVTVHQELLDKNLAAVSSFAEKVNVPVYLAIVPSAGWAAGMDGCQDKEIIDAMAAKSSVPFIDLTDVYEGRPELYYRTDHHWTSEGAFWGYQAIAAAMGAEAADENAFTRERIEGCFRGSTYSRSALWLTEPEDLELWHGSTSISVTSENNAPHSVFYRERLEEADKYTVFLNGNQPDVKLTNPEKTGKLLVIRDSYANCLGPFLAESWSQVELIDLRYYRSAASALAEDADAVLILYSIGNFLTDTNLVLLR